jgi:hypothetical protein
MGIIQSFKRQIAQRAIYRFVHSLSSTERQLIGLWSMHMNSSGQTAGISLIASTAEAELSPRLAKRYRTARIWSNAKVYIPTPSTSAEPALDAYAFRTQSALILSIIRSAVLAKFLPATKQQTILLLEQGYLELRMLVTIVRSLPDPSDFAEFASALYKDFNGDLTDLATAYHFTHTSLPTSPNDS